MSNPTLRPATRGRWVDWKPKARILEDPAESEPTKPSEPGSVGFEGATSAESPEIEAGPDPAELTRASGVLNRAGVRIMRLDDAATIGVWSDLDGPEVRAALRVLRMDRMPVVALESPGIPMRYKVRGVPEREQGMSWAEWKAAALNRLFQVQGTSGKPGRITAKTVRHGERTDEEAGAVE